MGLRMKNFNIFGINWKIRFLGGVHEKAIYRGELPKKVGLDSLQICAQYVPKLDKPWSKST